MRLTGRRDFLKMIACSAAGVAGGPFLANAARSRRQGKRPNILLLIAEDICADLSCYGVPAVHTPVLDGLAGDGIRYSHAFVTGPVCSASRSAIMTGMYQTSIGAHNHRTRGGKKDLPYPVKPYTRYLKDAGYYTVIKGKTDCNFNWDQKGSVSSTKDWSGRAEGQPFFCQMSFSVTHRTFVRDPERPINPADVDLPPVYPDHPLIRRDWTDYLESVQVMDRRVGEVLKQLDDEGVADDTVIIFIGDHGRCMPRGKQFCYDGGLHVPLIVRWPGVVKGGQVRDELISGIDISATILACAGVKVPDYMEGRPFLPQDKTNRKYVFSARDRCDGTIDRIRSVRSHDYKYLRNFYPERPYTQLNAYKEKQYPPLQVLKVLYKQGKLTPGQAHFMKPTRPKEELYDLRKDPYELNNLAGDAKSRKVLKEFRSQLDNWIKTTGDKGQTPEDPLYANDEYQKMVDIHKAAIKKLGFAPDYTPEEHLAWWEKEFAAKEAKSRGSSGSSRGHGHSH